jgi:hypothetical protein
MPSHSHAKQRRQPLGRTIPDRSFCYKAVLAVNVEQKDRRQGCRSFADGAMIDHVPEPETVWMVELGRGDLSEVNGELSLDRDALVFTRDVDGAHSFRLNLRLIRSARRVRGSPILMIRHRGESGIRLTAFYFAEPPPINPSNQMRLPRFGSGVRPGGSGRETRRTSKRRHDRGNLRYFTTWSWERKAVIKTWVNEIQDLIGKLD